MIKRNKIIYWIATIWLSLGMVSTGAAQLFDPHGEADFAAGLGYPRYLSTLLGAAKMCGVVALLIPKFPLLKEWAYAGFFFIMSGAVFSHLASGSATSELLPSLLLLALTFVSWYFRPANRRLIITNQ
jgi:hypothetical protein